MRVLHISNHFQLKRQVERDINFEERKKSKEEGQKCR
jgi:hypothetical protein